MTADDKITNNTTMSPTPKPDHLKRGDVIKLCNKRTALNGEYAVRTLFPKGSPARKTLIPGGKHVYIRAVVLEVLGLTDD